MEEQSAPIFERYGVVRAELFGSRARNEAHEASDIDILITLGDEPISLWDMVRMRDELTEVLGAKVDIVTDRSIVPYFRESIMSHTQVLYER